MGCECTHDRAENYSGKDDNDIHWFAFQSMASRLGLVDGVIAAVRPVLRGVLAPGG
jgi:hypothetical protein